jgi:hypothetical protein
MSKIKAYSGKEQRKARFQRKYNKWIDGARTGARTRQNARRLPRGRNWCFTLNNPGNVEIPGSNPPQNYPDTPNMDGNAEVLNHLFGNDERLEYAVFQLERESTLHYQGFLRFTRPVSFTSVKSIFHNSRTGPVHIELPRNSNQQGLNAARDYCMKQETRVAGPWERGMYFIGFPLTFKEHGDWEDTPLPQLWKRSAPTSCRTTRPRGRLRSVIPGDTLKTTRGYIRCTLFRSRDEPSHRLSTYSLARPGSGKVLTYENLRVMQRHTGPTTVRLVNRSGCRETTANNLTSCSTNGTVSGHFDNCSVFWMGTPLRYSIRVGKSSSTAPSSCSRQTLGQKTGTQDTPSRELLYSGGSEITPSSWSSCTGSCGTETGTTLGTGDTDGTAGIPPMDRSRRQLIGTPSPPEKLKEEQDRTSLEWLDKKQSSEEQEGTMMIVPEEEEEGPPSWSS